MSSRKERFASSSLLLELPDSGIGYWMQTTCLIQSCMGASSELTPGTWKQAELQIKISSENQDMNQSSEVGRLKLPLTRTHMLGAEFQMIGRRTMFRTPAIGCIYEKSQGCCGRQKSQWCSVGSTWQNSLRTTGKSLFFVRMKDQKPAYTAWY